MCSRIRIRASHTAARTAWRTAVEALCLAELGEGSPGEDWADAVDRLQRLAAIGAGEAGSPASTELLGRRKRHPASGLRSSLHLGSERDEERMEIGEPRRTVTVEPLEEPVPRELPEEPPEEEPAEPPREPEQVPA
jgi:hypothetical protein